MEASIRDFVGWRLREIDRFLTGLYGTRRRWLLVFWHECKVHPHETARGFLRIMDSKPGRIQKWGDAINLRIAGVLEKWAKTKHGFVSEYVVTKPSRFTTRRSHLRTGDSVTPTNIPEPDTTPTPKRRLTRSKRPSVPLSLDERDPDLFELLAVGTQSQYLQSKDTEASTISVMSNPEPSELQSDGCPRLPEPSPTPPPPDPGLDVPGPAMAQEPGPVAPPAIDPAAFGAALDRALETPGQ